MVSYANIQNNKSSWRINSVLIFCIALFAKQFYILPSGSFQLGDLFFMIFSFYTFFMDKGKKVICKKDLNLIIFVLIAIFINIFVYISTIIISGLFPSFPFLVNLYYVYNIIIVIAFRKIFNDEYALSMLSKTLKCALVCQFLIYLVGIGRYYDNVRYQGTFNDPNQYGFYVLTSVFVIYNISKALNEKYAFFWSVLGFYLISLSSSTGMLLGIFGFLAFSFFFYLYNKLPKKIFFLIFIVCLVVFLAFVYLIFCTELISVLEANIDIDNTFVERIFGKIKEFSSNFFFSFAKDRNMTRVINSPVFFLVGSGEGTGEAYGIVFNEIGDIHSDIFSILFSYGIIPSLFLFAWIFQNFKNISTKYLSIYIGLFLESLTLVNHRQPIFWCLLVMASFDVFKKTSCKKQ